MPGSTGPTVTATVQAPAPKTGDTENRIQAVTDVVGKDTNKVDVKTTDTGTEPVQPTDQPTDQGTVTGDVTAAAAPEVTAPADTDAVETPKANGKPLIRISPIAKPNEGMTAGTGTSGKAQPPSLRKALGIKGHPVRDLVKSVSKALGIDRPAKGGSNPKKATTDAKDTKAASDAKDAA